MRRIIITGATSGIGEAVARYLIQQDELCLGLIGRNQEKLAELKALKPERVWTKHIDLQNIAETLVQYRALVQDLGAYDCLILNAGVSLANPEFNFAIDQQLINVNILSFIALADEAIPHFIRQGHGRLVGVSSVSGYTGSKNCVYSASKRFISQYLENLRTNLPLQYPQISITEIVPGYVETGITEDKNRTFWLVQPADIAPAFVAAVNAGRAKAYLPGRWKWVVLLIQLLPKSLRLYFVRRHYKQPKP